MKESEKEKMIKKSETEKERNILKNESKIKKERRKINN